MSQAGREGYGSDSGPLSTDAASAFTKREGVEYTMLTFVTSVCAFMSASTSSMRG